MPNAGYQLLPLLCPLCCPPMGILCSVPDPPDPHVFGPPGSVSFCHQAKIVRKTLTATGTVLSLPLDFFLYLQTRNKQKNFFKTSFLFASWRSKTKIAGSGSESISQRHGSADPDPGPHQNVMDPEHWFFGSVKIFCCWFARNTSSRTYFFSFFRCYEDQIGIR